MAVLGVADCVRYHMYRHCFLDSYFRLRATFRRIVKGGIVCLVIMPRPTGGRIHDVLFKSKASSDVELLRSKDEVFHLAVRFTLSRKISLNLYLP